LTLVKIGGCHPPPQSPARRSHPPAAHENGPIPQGTGPFEVVLVACYTGCGKHIG
jgi:hypothetical protein